MKVTRLYTGKDLQTYFDDIILPMQNGEIGKISEEIAVKKMIVGAIEDFKEISWHNAPCRQYIIVLEGHMEIEIGDGTKRSFHPGDILLAEDLTGQGHITRAVSDGRHRYLAIPI